MTATSTKRLHRRVAFALLPCLHQRRFLASLPQAAAYHARALKLVQRAVLAKGEMWPTRSLIEPLVALAGAAFSLTHFSQSRTLYEQALQVGGPLVGGGLRGWIELLAVDKLLGAQLQLCGYFFTPTGAALGYSR